MTRQTNVLRSQIFISSSSETVSLWFRNFAAHFRGNWKEVIKKYFYIFRNLKFLGHVELKGHINYVLVYKNIKNNAVDRIDEIMFIKFIMRYNKVRPLCLRENLNCY